jgi:tetratricopeptide (TPR) repeat protein
MHEEFFMKARSSALVLLLVPLLTFGAPASPVVLKGPHYAVTSWAGVEAGQTTLDVMEALLARYNSLFLFDLSKAPGLWNVVLYNSKADFDAALAGQVAAVPADYVYLHYADPERSHLAAWVPGEGSPVDEVRSLAFQGFFQFLWTFLPHPPAWIETGLASVFWNSHWDGKTLTANPDLPYLETLQDKWKDKAPDLKALLSAPEGTLDAGSGRDLEAWGLAAFLLESPDPTYARLFGSALGNLSPTASEEANRDAAYQRFAAAKDLNAAALDVQAYWKAKQGFAAHMAQGSAFLKEKNLQAATAAFQGALALRPLDDGALYFAGLTAYEAKEYLGADAWFAKVTPKALPPGLLAYARGLTAFALKQNDKAKTWLLQAKAEDSPAYDKLVAPVLELIR